MREKHRTRALLLFGCQYVGVLCVACAASPAPFIYSAARAGSLYVHVVAWDVALKKTLAPNKVSSHLVKPVRACQRMFFPHLEDEELSHILGGNSEIFFKAML